MKKLFFIFIILFFIGCNSKYPYYEWRVDYEPITEQERVDINEHIKSILSLTKRDISLGNDDQDIEDFVDSVYRNAKNNICKPRLFEYIVIDQYISRKTGKWKELEKYE